MPAVKHNKQNVSVTLDPILVKQAREIGINLSQTLTSALKSEIHSIEMTRWQKENARAIDYLNDLTEENGLLSDEYRTF
ncbi:type II toxin-antitoxin system CcdA family antitoxin [Raoultella ornithinolytica]|uniref:type II toxin-antitoxin system CcdA family antitoxin n=1 Tax=Raoultella ornithinolytica TaxID=54291 RepID=UPI000F6C6C42|nr:type II toxin-antitoxin system CcdA family antitoxin [Raoultella ornithinolytica]MEB8020612.1 type II toxin-antitoxin system CcdA family antitoxin [Raoultella ornithinolytica]VEB64503.1 CcdA protein (antitoxin to CcdB) [Raoultella ornithinolytica]